MKFTRRALGEVTAAAFLAPAAALAQAGAQTTPPEAGQRNWLAEARASKAAAAQTIARVALPMDVEPAFRFRA